MGLALLAGCAAGTPQSTFNPAESAVAASHGMRQPARRSWMSPDAKRKDLLYVSDAEANLVDVYSYPGGKLEGQLSGFAGVQGLCTDKSGNVWITNQSQETILEFAHGGKSPIATLNDSGYHPGACSVDPSTGNLAVANLDTLSEGAGGLAIYTGAKGSPQLYNDSTLAYAFYVAYDRSGNVFVDGQNRSSQLFFGELPKSSSTLETIDTSGISGLGAGVAWDGKYITLGITSPSTIYQLTVSGSAASIAGTTTISGDPGLGGYDVVTKGNRQGTLVIDPETGGTKDVGYFKYPSGSGPTKSITGLENPDSVAISIAK
jgi:hypothetical protein